MGIIEIISVAIVIHAAGLLVAAKAIDIMDRIINWAY